MKYMGSKRAMLHNGLGKVLAREVGSATRFVDLFAGSGAVATHVACRFDVSVLAFDLQMYSAVLANAVLSRNVPFDSEAEWARWLSRAKRRVGKPLTVTTSPLSRKGVARARQWCSDQTDAPITRAYGGYYFSPEQTQWIDALRRVLPRSEPARTICLAALIAAASRCAAAPGHTAQPFRPTITGLPFLQTAWSKDLLSQTQTALKELADRFARRSGRAAISDANRAATQLKERDLVFIDPPYSAVQYSRFYHVLETIAAGDCGDVSGAGRYPPPKLRPRSRYSLVSESLDAFEDLLATIASRGARVVLTFPNHECSNGLSGESVRDIAADHFYIRTDQLDSNFSTLGGRGGEQSAVADRSARHAAEELVLLLEPR